MLRESFVLLDGVRRQRERSFWEQGIRSWNDFCDKEVIKGVSPPAKRRHDAFLKLCRKKLLEDDARFFASAVPGNEQWRLYDDFKDGVHALDIETGMRGEVTVVGVASADGCKTLLRGSTLHRESLRRVLADAKMLLSFNGRGFDVPVLERHFGISIDVPHIDLLHVSRALGYSGGLKILEKELGIKRPDELSVLRGAQAPELWRCYKATGDEHFLNLLVKYNEEDCLNLHTLADMLIPRLWQDVRKA